MRPETTTVQQLFERDVRYEVPLYQRPYVWKREAQWAPLWDDISAVLDHDLNGHQPTHFLGAIVLEQEPTNPGQIPRYTVIDGQQRLTTLQILIAAAAKEIDSVGAADQAGLLRNLVLNDPRRAKGVDQLKVWPTNADRAAFTTIVGSVELSPASSDSNHAIVGAFDYFADQVRRYLAGDSDGDEPMADFGDGRDIDDSSSPPDGGPVEDRAERLRIVLCDLLKLVSITLGTDDNAQVIFEPLNARGTPLLALDLVKNVLFTKLRAKERTRTRCTRRYGSPSSTMITGAKTAVKAASTGRRVSCSWCTG